MKKYLFVTIVVFTLSLIIPTRSFAQGMMQGMMGGNDTTISESESHTTQGEAEGKGLWEGLQANELGCENLSDEDFHALGMYFMSLMAGDSHEAMDTMMTQMMGEEGEDQMHIAMGKRMSGCDSDAALPQSMPALSGFEGMSGNMMPMMMNMMMGGGNNPMGTFSWGLGSWLVTLTLLVWLVVGVLAAIWLAKQIRKK